MKSLLVLILAAIFLVPLARTALAAPAPETTPNVTANLTQLPFKGSFQSTEIYVRISPTMSVNASGSGNATQLGQLTVNYELEVNLLDLSGTGSLYLAGTNGDSIQAKGIGQAVPDRTPDMFNIVEIYTITGGTGRFKGASGTFTLHRLISITTGAALSNFEGYILIPWK
jgi:hypothetical protein